ncbi:MAG: hypothetical protein AAGH64_06155 [Planctomycetota bacterium]
MKPASEMSQGEINRFCSAANAVYFRVLRSHALRTGERIALPSLVCPKGQPPCVCGFGGEELAEAEDFLVRLGVIAGFDDEGDEHHDRMDEGD